MAINLGSYRRKAARQKASADIAKQFEEEQAKSKKRSRWSGLLGGVGGKLLGSGIAGAFGIASGGLLMPLIMGASSFGSKKLAHELTRGMAGDPSKIKGDKYGFGEKEATTLREGLEQQLRASDPTKQHGAIGKDIALSYISAGAQGKLGGVKGALKGDTKQLWMGGKGDVIGTGLDAPRGWEGFKAGAGEAMGLGSTFGGDPEDDVISEGTKVAKDQWGNPVSEEILEGTETVMDQWENPVSEDQWGNPFSEEIPFKKDGGMVQDRSPSIADYFNLQGLSLGGSSKQSLSQMLGRK